MSADARLFRDVTDVGLTIFCRENVDAERAMALRAAGADVQPVDLDENGKLSLSTVLATIAEMWCDSLMVEAGGKLAASLLRNDLVDRILWTQGQQIIGRTAFCLCCPGAIGSNLIKGIYDRHRR